MPTLIIRTNTKSITPHKLYYYHSQMIESQIQSFIKHWHTERDEMMNMLINGEHDDDKERWFHYCCERMLDYMTMHYHDKHPTVINAKNIEHDYYNSEIYSMYRKRLEQVFFGKFIRMRLINDRRQAMMFKQWYHPLTNDVIEEVLTN